MNGKRIALSLSVSALLTWATIWGFLQVAPSLMKWAATLPPMALKLGTLGLLVVMFFFLVAVIVRNRKVK